MIVRIFKKSKHRKNALVDPDEIFLDSKNIQNFDRQQFEGRIEKPITQKTVLFLGIFFLLIGFGFGSRLIYLQVKNGDAYRTRSENNILEKINILSDRGIIYDRNKVELAWNKKNGDTEIPTRTYLTPGLGHLLGYVSYPQKDSTGNYWQPDFIGKDGLEKEYNDNLKGENGSKIIETNALGKVYSENIVNSPKRGDDLVTTIDSQLQSHIFTFIKTMSDNQNFNGGAGVIMDVQTGEMLADTSYPEYNSEILSQGQDKTLINDYIHNPKKVFLDRSISGLYTPGSIVKPYFALGALAENLISPTKQILSTGSISIPNPYFPDQKTVFKDWRANGWTDMARAIAVSSDVYFYSIGGGYADQKGLGIANIEKYAKDFGIGTPTGIDLPSEKGGTIPSPEWKIKNFPGDPWRLGDTYHTAIGQYGFQVTPMEMVRAVGAIANYGKLLTPHLILGDTAKENKFTMLNTPKSDFDVVHDGMRQAVTSGTATILNVPYVQVAVKTGTAQLGTQKNRDNSWVMGFLPYDHPKYAFVILMEAGPSTTNEGASTIMRQTLDWMSANTPQYLQ